ncbi:MAG TPA: ubiquinol-cytochrome C chaperone family protein [Acetobacteraceae bacterium]|nr:ubiquinol-cytochrome C chaperone family protein [Acetobacteraceae bacterium]
MPDTLDGRFDMVGLYAFLLIERLRLAPEPGPALAQAVFDAMFSDMDVNLREMGVGDLSVGKKVKAMWEAFHGRATVYAAALADTATPALEAAIARNVWRGANPPPGAAGSLARLVRNEHAHLRRQQLAILAQGEVRFLAAEPN